MVFKKYLSKNGKKYGPYLYENKRVGEKVVTKYMGPANESRVGSFFEKLKEKKWSLFLILSLLFVGFLLVLDIFLQFSPTGWALLNLQPKYEIGESLSGFIDLGFEGGELIPKSALLYVGLGQQQKIFNLSDVIDRDSIYGNFYASNSYISGDGEGYGAIGKKISYPTLNFKIRIYSDENSEELVEENENISSGGSDPESSQTPEENATSESTQLSEQNVAESIPEIPGTPENVETSETPALISEIPQPPQTETTETIQENSNEDSSETVESSSGSLITGGVISQTEQTISVSVSRNSPFEYNLEEGQNFEIIGDIVDSEGNVVSSGLVDIIKEDDKLKISTDYYLEEEGFGADYLTSELVSVPISINKLGLVAENSTLEVKLVYQDNLIVSAEKIIRLVEFVNESFTAGNLTLNETPNLILLKNIETVRIKSGESISLNLSEYFGNAKSYGFNVDNISGVFEGDILTLISDEGFKGARKARIIAYFENEMLESNEFNILVSSGAVRIDSARSDIKIGETVKWTLNVSLDIAENISVELPISAENIVVSEIEGGIKQEIQPEIKKIIGGDEEVVQEARSENSHETLLSGNVVADVKLKKRDSILFSVIRNLIKFTGFAVDLNETDPVSEIKDSLVVNINFTSTNYVVEYETPAPVAYENETNYGKQVVISAADELNYTDVLSFTNISETLNVGQEDKIKIFWVENNSYVALDAYDLDGNNKLDYVEWITPHLSDQNFDISYGTYPLNLIVSCDAECPLDPDPSGEYVFSGYYEGYPMYNRSDSEFNIWVPISEYLLTNSSDFSIRATYNSWQKHDLSVAGIYTAAPGRTGNVSVSVVVPDTYYIIYDCTNIIFPGTYTLNQSITTTESCFNITADGVVLDGNGFSITGDGVGQDWGVIAAGVNGTVIRNISIIGFGEDATDGGGAILLGDNWYGIQSTSNSLVEDVYINSAYFGILVNGNSNVINRVDVGFAVEAGVNIWNVGQNNIIQNSVINNVVGLDSVEMGYGGITLSSDGNTVRNVSLSGNGRGIYVLSSNNNLENIISNSNAEEGIYFLSGLNNLTNVTVNSNSQYDIYCATSDINSKDNLVFGTQSGCLSWLMRGSGTAEDPYQIDSWAALNATRNNLTAYYILTANLSSSDGDYIGIGDSWVPIGDQTTPFVGNLDGQNNTISDLVINLPERSLVGFFGIASGNIYNLGLADINITGYNPVGGLAGWFEGGIVSNCYVTGNIYGEGTVGGLIGNSGNLNGIIINSHSDANVNYIGSGAEFDTIFGGLVGYAFGNISNSYSTGNVAGYGEVGGLAGRIDSDGAGIFNSYASGNVSGNNKVGGFSGAMGRGTLSNSYSSGSVDGGDYTGGLVGYDIGIGGIVSNSYSTGNVTGFSNVGGLAGLGAIISNSYSTGNVIGSGDLVGGLVGRSSGDVSYSYSTGSVTGGVEGISIGGLVGSQSGGIISGSYSTGNVSGGYDVGGLVGFSGAVGSINNSYATGNISGGNSVGGLVGKSFGIINNSYATGFVLGDSAIGGLVGDLGDYFGGSMATISNSYSTGNVNGEGSGEESAVGGLVGYQWVGTISNSYSTGNVIGGSASLGNYVGGFVGDSRGTISNSYSTGNVNVDGFSTYDIVGGFIGSSDATISNSYSTGNVFSSSSQGNVGGFVGNQWEGYGATINNSYSTGDVTGSGIVGGFIGVSAGMTDTTEIFNSYSTGDVMGPRNSVGGFAGQIQDGAIYNSYWDINTSGQETSAGGTGKTTAEMKKLYTFNSFGGNWNISGGAEDLNNGYPYLSWQAGNNSSVWKIADDPFKLTECGTISSPGVYTLQNDISQVVGTCFNITADNIVLDGNGFSISGNYPNREGYGIDASGGENLTVKNFGLIMDFVNGIGFISNGNIIINNSIMGNADSGIVILGANNYIANNKFNANTFGIYGTYYNSAFINNTASSNYATGIYLRSGSNNIFLNITAESNTNYGIYLESSSNNTLSNINANSNAVGLNLLQSSNNTLSNINVNSNGNGIILESSSNNNFSNMNVSLNTFNGIRLYFSSNNNILSNITVNSNAVEGITLASNSSNNILSNINVDSHAFGLYLLNTLNNTFNGVLGSSSQSDAYCENSDSNINAGLTFETQSGCDAWINTLYPGSISSCGTLNQAGTYTLQNNIGNGGDCIKVNADNVVINGRGFAINGNVNARRREWQCYDNCASPGSEIYNYFAYDLTTGNGYDAWINLNLVNLSISQNVDSRGGVAGDTILGASGGHAGSVNFSSVNVSGDINAQGGNGYDGGNPGNGGGLVFFNSNVSGTVNTFGGPAYTLNSVNGGNGGNVGLNKTRVGGILANGGIGLNGGNGGSVRLVNGSFSGDISSFGGSSSIRGGAGGIINVTDSVSGNLNSYAGSGAGAPGGLNGGNVFLRNSVAENISTQGGFASGDYCGNSGSITLINSSAENLNSSGVGGNVASTGLAGEITLTSSNITGDINAYGGQSETGTGGNGATINITSSNVSGGINVSGGDGGIGGSGGAIMIANSNITTITSDDGNYGNGPAISREGDVVISGSRIMLVSAQGGDGVNGGDSSAGGNVTIINSIIENVTTAAGNWMVGDSGNSGKNGGAVNVINSTIAFINTTGGSGAFGSASGNAGAINISLSNITGDIVAIGGEGGGSLDWLGSEPAGGNGAMVNITSSNVSGDIDAYGGSSNNGNGGNGGVVNITFSNVSGDVNAYGGGSNSGDGGDGGNTIINFSSISGNLNISGASSIGPGMGMGVAGNAGSLTFLNSNASNIYAEGGNGFAGSEGGNAAGDGGSIVFVSSISENIILSGGNSASGGLSIGGSAGNAQINDSTITSITSRGGTSSDYTRDGGALTIFNSSITSIDVTGGARSYGTPGSGGIITANGSSFITITSNGGYGDGSYTGGSGGTIDLKNSDVKFINSVGGGSYMSSGGSGGQVILINSEIPTITAINLLGGLSDMGSENGLSGTLTLNQSTIYNEIGSIKFSYLTTQNTSFDSILSIGNNSAYVDSENYPDYNVSADVTLDLSGFSIINPKILKDGEMCSAPFCNVLSYLNKIITFNVSSWSNYSVDTNPNLTSCLVITEPGKYIIQSDIYNIVGTCFDIQADNVILDGNGKILLGETADVQGYGIYANGRNNITIKNFADIGGFDSSSLTGYSGISFEGVSNSFIQNVNIITNNNGISLESSSNNILSNITAESNTNYGIYLESSSNNTLSNITANSNSDYGIYLSPSSDNVLSNINANSNGNGIFIEGSNNNNLTNINVDSNRENGIFLDNSNFNVFANVNASFIMTGAAPRGIVLVSSSYNNLTNVNASFNEGGIVVSQSSNNILSNIVSNENSVGISLYIGSNNTLSNITANLNTGRGIGLESSSNNILSKITANSNGYGIYLDSSSNNILSNIVANLNLNSGVALYFSNNNTLLETIVNENSAGIEFCFTSNNILNNLQSYSNVNIEIFSCEGSFLSSINNTLTYNNSNGEIRFPLDADVLSAVKFGEGQVIEIGDNYAYVDVANLPEFNKSANVTLFNNKYANASGRDLKYIKPYIDSAFCSGCVGFTAYNAQNVSFSVPFTGNISLYSPINLSAYFEVPLGVGWNMFGIETNSNVSGDKEIALEQGWNLIAYSSDNETNFVDNAKVEVSGIEKSWTAAVQAREIQYQIAYYNTTAKDYRYAPLQDSNLRAGKAYWVYANNESTTLKLSGVGGSSVGETYNLADLKFVNATSGEVKSIGDAASVGWVQGGGQDEVIYKFTDDPYYPWKTVPSDPSYCDIQPDIYICSNVLNSWEGYFINTGVNNLSIVRN